MSSTHFHLHANVVRRSKGQSLTAAIAYRAGERIEDYRTGEVFDFTRKGGVVNTQLFVPYPTSNGCKKFADQGREKIWNAIEQHTKHPRAVVGREFVVALPAEMDLSQRNRLGNQFGQYLSSKYKIIVDAGFHLPWRGRVDNNFGEEDLENECLGLVSANSLKAGKNWHVHFLAAWCQINEDGELLNKCYEFDPIFADFNRLCKNVPVERIAWQDIENDHLEQCGIDYRVDCRSYADRGINKAAGVKNGKVGQDKVDKSNRNGSSKNYRPSNFSGTATESDIWQLIKLSKKSTETRIRSELAVAEKRVEQCLEGIRDLTEKAELLLSRIEEDEYEYEKMEAEAEEHAVQNHEYEPDPEYLAGMPYEDQGPGPDDWRDRIDGDENEGEHE